MKLSETFTSPESRVYRVFLFVDMTESTKMKENEAEASWLTTYGWYFDKVNDSIAANGGSVVKYLGDGVMAVFDDEHAADAINSAIQLQEEVAIGNENRQVVCHCSIGIATGEVIEFQTPRGDQDYIGTVVDRASRLCSAASPKAIFVDKNTIAIAFMRRVKSRLGEAKAPRRTVDEYQGALQKIPLKGLIAPVEYHEIFWDQQLFGVKSSAVTTEAANPAPRNVQDGQPTTHQRPNFRNWQQGKVTKLYDRYGFIRSDSGESHEDFYFNPDFLFNKELKVFESCEVWFMPAPPVGDSRQRRAMDVIAFNACLQGRLAVVDPRGFGYVDCNTDGGESVRFFLDLGGAHGWHQGERVKFILGKNAKGPAGVKPTKLE